MIPSRSGRIITFYSYKGGTGRSMALANIAWILASNGKRVLAIDWDIEAPGLHRYFAPFLPDPELTSSDGVIDLVHEFAEEAMTPGQPESSAGSEWWRPLSNLARFALPLNFAFKEGGRLDFVPAGRQGMDYAARVSGFNWPAFYGRLGGGVFLDALREWMRDEYDYVLIDSRTGVSDTAGVCTVRMADALVVCYTANNQSIEGASAVAASIREQWQAARGAGGAPLPIFPILTRVELGETDKLALRRSYARRELGKVAPAFEGNASYWGGVEVPYVPFYAFEEVLATFKDEPGARISLLAPFEQLTAHLTDGAVTRLVPPTAQERAQALEKYARVPGVGEYDVFLLANDRDAAVEKIARRLKQSGLRVWFHGWDIIPGEDTAERMTDALMSSSACAFFVGPSVSADDEIARLVPDLAAELERRSFRIIPVLLPGAAESSLPQFLRNRTLVDFRQSLEDEAAFHRLLSGIRGVAPGPSAPEVEAPYKGLEPFDVADAPLFFGRETLARPAVDRLRAVLEGVGPRVLAIFGSSGSGKTSLMHAGILAALAGGAGKGSEKWPVAELRPGKTPLESLAVALARIPELARSPSVGELVGEMRRDPNALHVATRSALESAPRDSRLVIVVDQLEEVFRFCTSPDDRRTFLDNLAAAASAPGGRVVVLTTLRAHAFQRLGDHRFATFMQLESVSTALPVRLEEIRTMIVEPAKFVGIDIETALADRLAEDFVRQPGGVAVLEAVLEKLWEKRGRADRTITEKAYEALGRLSGLIARFADDAFDRIPVEHRAVAESVLLRAARDGRLSRAQALPHGASNDDVLEELADARLLTIDQVGNVELAHGELTSWPKLRGWLKNSADLLNIRGKLGEAAAKWHLQSRPMDRVRDFISADDLRAAERWFGERPGDLAELNQLEHAFYTATQNPSGIEIALGKTLSSALATVGVDLPGEVGPILAWLALRWVRSSRLGRAALAVVLIVLVGLMGAIVAQHEDYSAGLAAAEARAQASEAARAHEAPRAKALGLVAHAYQAASRDQPLSYLLAAEAWKTMTDANLRLPAVEKALFGIGGTSIAEVVALASDKVALSPDGRWFAEITAKDGLLWDFAAASASTQHAPITTGSFAFSADSRWLALAHGNSVDLRSLEPGTASISSFTLPGLSSEDHVVDLVISDGAERFAARTWQGRLFAGSLRAAVHHPHILATNKAGTIGISRSGRWVFESMGDRDSATEFWDTTRYDAPSVRVTGSPFDDRGQSRMSEDGRWLVLRSRASLTLLDLSEGPGRTITLEGSDDVGDAGSKLFLSNGSPRLFLWGNGVMAKGRMWDLSVSSPAPRELDVRISSFGLIVASPSARWFLADELQRGLAWLGHDGQADATPFLHEAFVRRSHVAVTFSRAGDRLAIARSDASVEVMNHSLPNHPSIEIPTHLSVRGLVFTEGDRRLLVEGGDQLWLWPLRPEDAAARLRAAARRELTSEERRLYVDEKD